MFLTCVCFFLLYKRKIKNSNAARNATPPTTPPIMGPRGRVDSVDEVGSGCGAGVCSCNAAVVVVVVVVDVSSAEVDVVGSGVVDEVVKMCVLFTVETMVAFCAHVGFGMITSTKV